MRLDCTLQWMPKYQNNYYRKVHFCVSPLYRVSEHTFAPLFLPLSEAALECLFHEYLSLPSLGCLIVPSPFRTIPLCDHFDSREEPEFTRLQILWERWTRICGKVLMSLPFWWMAGKPICLIFLRKGLAMECRLALNSLWSPSWPQTLWSSCLRPPDYRLAPPCLTDCVFNAPHKLSHNEDL